MRLNPQQSEIVDFPLNASTLVIAGAGSGKTTVIAQRALKLAGELPVGLNVQMLTFSNKAAKEMKERVKRVNGIIHPAIKFDTYHSFGMKLIKSDPAGFGLTPEFSLLSDTDVKRAIRALAQNAGLPKRVDKEDKQRLNPMNWLNTWSLKRQAGYDVRNEAKNKAVLTQALQEAHKLSSSETEIAWSTLTGFEKLKQSTNCLDFDDLIFLPLLRIARDPVFLNGVRAELGCAVVDEAQDSNRVQYEIVKRIALGHCAVTMVGDDDQSIYGWRGANVRNLQLFLRDFDALDLRLEQNYRSTQRIVNTANQLIEFNESRMPKTPFSEGKEGTDPYLSEYANSWDMVQDIAVGIKRRIADGIAPSEIAVLYRTNRMAMLIEPALRKLGIPYHVVGGMSLFDRAEVVAITNAIRLARNPRDTHALKALTPYIDKFGESSSYAVCDWLERTPSASVYELPSQLDDVPTSRISALRSFVDELQGETLMCHRAPDFVKWAVEGPMALLEREKDDQLREKRAQHIQLLAENIESELAERVSAGESLTWRDIAVEIALRDAGQTEGDRGQVTLSTLHRSKGLEWPEVLLVGMSEGLMPLDSRSTISEEDAGYSHMEEERRLAYVGITRGMHNVEFFHSERYAFPGGEDDKQYEPSRFLIEMGYSPKQMMEHETASKGTLQSGSYSDVANALKTAMGMV